MRLLAIDPGETTGYSIWEIPDDMYGRPFHPYADMSQYLVTDGELSYHHGVEELIKSVDIVVFEKFLLYAHKAKTQIGSEFITSQIIGIIKYICNTHNRAWFSDTAQHVKGYFTDNKLQVAGILKTKSRHSKDSIRHALYHINFNAKKECVGKWF